jgi:integrase
MSWYFLTFMVAQRIHHSFRSEQFPRLLRSAQIPQIDFHDLRHMAATRLLRRGVQVKVVSEMLGHASIAVTLQIYAHVLPNIQREAAAMASKMFGDETEN